MNPFRPESLSTRAWILLIALWVLTHPWEGLRHDGILYAAQAMLHLHPDVFSGDLFFAYGSQDDYTIFGRLYASAIDVLGLGTAALLLWAIAQAMWVAAAVAWTKRLAGPGQVLSVAAIAFSLPSIYSADTALRFAESFLTARSFAEPLALAGLLAAYSGRRWVAVVVLLASASFHPIMALPGVVSALLLAVGWRVSPTGWVAATALAGLAAAALAFSGVLPKMDPQWLSVVATRSPIVIAGEWLVADWVRMLYPVAILALVAGLARDVHARLWAAIAACGIFGISVSALSWLIDWPLGLQAQTWRFVWLASWAAPLAALAAAFRADRKPPAARIALVATVPGMVLLGQGFWSLSWLLPILHLAVLWFCLGQQGRASQRARAIATVQATLATGASLVGGLMVAIVLWRRPVLLDEIGGGRGVRTVVSYLGWALVAGTLWFATRKTGWGAMRAPARSLVGVAVAAALVTADARSPTVARLEALAAEGIPDWAAVIPMDATVLWPSNAASVWFALSRRSYVSRAQLAGVVFSQGTALEGLRRLLVVERLAGRDAVLAFRSKDRLAKSEPPGRTDLERACADPVLGFVVLEQRLGPVIGSPFHDPVSGDSFHLHRCSDYRIDRS